MKRLRVKKKSFVKLSKKKSFISRRRQQLTNPTQSSNEREVRNQNCVSEPEFEYVHKSEGPLINKIKNSTTEEQADEGKKHLNSRL